MSYDDYGKPNKGQMAKAIAELVEIEMRRSFPVPVRDLIYDILLDRLAKEDKSLLSETCSSLGLWL